jgi:hypothetical protein
LATDIFSNFFLIFSRVISIIGSCTPPFNCGHMSARPSLSKKKAKVAQSDSDEVSDVMSSSSESEAESDESDDGTVPCRCN